MEKLVMKKCLKCGALVQVLQDSSALMCCGEKMMDVKSNSTDASFEKHVPVYKRMGDDIEITVNHVMEEEHYIEWILIAGVKESRKMMFRPGDELKVVVPYEKGSIIYSYCNKHGLWECVVE